MSTVAAPIVAGIAASLLTLFDLDRTFYVPANVSEKGKLYTWWLAFIAGNGLLAAGLYVVLGDSVNGPNLHWLVVALGVGVGYLALVRLKFTTLNWQGHDVPIGVETLYEGAKYFVFKRINRIARKAFCLEARDLAQAKNLAELVAEARLLIGTDQVWTDAEKIDRKKWILSVLRDPDASDEEKRLSLACFIKAGLMA